MNPLFAIALLSAVAMNSGDSYVDRLRSLDGQEYGKVNCSRYITVAKQHADCSAREFWGGCSGDLDVIQEEESIESVNLSALHNGDVVDFSGVHLAVVLDGGLTDSIPERGVGRISHINKFDPWYSGKVRILRWRSA